MLRFYPTTARGSSEFVPSGRFIETSNHLPGQPVALLDGWFSGNTDPLPTRAPRTSGHVDLTD
jgi:hypothetical protein